MADRSLSKKKKKAGAPPPPAAEAAPAPPEYEIDIYRAWCKQCGLCAAFCPRKCLSLDAEGNPVVTRGERCTGCGWCELHCPDFAISVRQCLKKLAAEKAD